MSLAKTPRTPRVQGHCFDIAVSNASHYLYLPNTTHPWHMATGALPYVHRRTVCHRRRMRRSDQAKYRPSMDIIAAQPLLQGRLLWYERLCHERRNAQMWPSQIPPIHPFLACLASWRDHLFSVYVPDIANRLLADEMLSCISGKAGVVHPWSTRSAGKSVAFSLSASPM